MASWNLIIAVSIFAIVAIAILIKKILKKELDPTNLIICAAGLIILVLVLFGDIIWWFSAMLFRM